MLSELCYCLLINFEIETNEIRTVLTKKKLKIKVYIKYDIWIESFIVYNNNNNTPRMV
jgi:hypothetical protein